MLVSRCCKKSISMVSVEFAYYVCDDCFLPCHTIVLGEQHHDDPRNESFH